jgi:hypothetical protein
MTRWNQSLLDEMRGLGDPAADAVVGAVFARGQVARVNALLADLVSNDQLPRAADFPEVQDFLIATAVQPAWAEQPQIEIGERLFLQWGLMSISVLACASLPECYILGDVATVLGRTRELRDHVNRRMPETVMMVLAVMDRGGLGPGGTGIRVTQKVRLMHAAIRHLVLQPSSAPGGAPPKSLGDVYLASNWDPARGQPISQEDLACVILTFSHVVMRGWRDLGISVTAEEQQAFVHCWNVVGHILGIEDRFLARDPDDARELFEAIKRERMAETTDGRHLTASLLAYSESFAPEPRFVFRPVSRILMNTLLDAQTRMQLGVPRLNWLERLANVGLLRLVWAVNKFNGDLFRAMPGTGGLAAVFSKAILKQLLAVNRGGARPPFQIPDGLAKQWSVPRTA